MNTMTILLVGITLVVGCDDSVGVSQDGGRGGANDAGTSTGGSSGTRGQAGSNGDSACGNLEYTMRCEAANPVPGLPSALTFDIDIATVLFAGDTNSALSYQIDLSVVPRDGLQETVESEINGELLSVDLALDGVEPGSFNAEESRPDFINEPELGEPHYRGAQATFPVTIIDAGGVVTVAIRGFRIDFHVSSLLAEETLSFSNDDPLCELSGTPLTLRTSMQ